MKQTEVARPFLYLNKRQKRSSKVINLCLQNTKQMVSHVTTTSYWMEPKDLVGSVVMEVGGALVQISAVAFQQSLVKGEADLTFLQNSTKAARWSGIIP